MIRIIRKSEGKQDAAQKLMKRFKLDDEQVDAILEMKLYKLARLEILVIQKELKEKRAESQADRSLLKDPQAAGRVVTRRARPRSRNAYADKRRTKIGGAGGEEVEYSRGGLHRRRGRPRGPHARRLDQARARDEGPAHHPPARGRRGDGGRARGSLKSNLVLLLATSAPPTSPASTTSRPPPATATRCRSCSSSTTASGWSARCRWTRGCRGPEKLLGVSRARLRAALPAGAAHRGLHPRRPPLCPARRGRRADRRACRSDEKDLLAVVTEHAHALVTQGERGERARRTGPRRDGDQGRGGRPGAGLPLHLATRTRRIDVRDARRAGSWCSRPAKYEVSAPRRARAARWRGRTTVKAASDAPAVDAAAGREEGGALTMATAKKATARGGATAPATSRSSRAWSRSASGRRCTSAAPTPPGYHHLLWEIVDNCVDEVINGYADRVEVTLHKDGKTVTVTDDGRGIPVDVHAASTRSRRWRSSSPPCTRAGSSSRATTCTRAACTASAARW